MSDLIRRIFSSKSSFAWNRQGAFDRAYGRVWSAGIDATLPDRPSMHRALEYITEHPTIEDALEEYAEDFLRANEGKNVASRFPPYYEVEGYLNFLLDHEVLVDFLGLRAVTGHKTAWEHKAHVAYFIIRMQRERMREEKRRDLREWRTGHHWCAAYVLWEMLYWRHTEWQREYIRRHEGTENPPAPEMYNAVAPGTGLQSYAEIPVLTALYRFLLEDL